MLTQKEIIEINSLIDGSTNPLFMFDDDPDGVCAYLLLKKYYKKGEGFALKGPPNITVETLNVITKYNPDLIIVLDKPLIDQEFIDQAPCKIVWMDHHPLVERDNVNYYNPRKNDEKDNRPTTALAFSIVKTNIWIAIIGCIFDHYIPDFVTEFIDEYKDLMNKVPKDPSDVRFETEFGKIIKIFSFNLKGESKDVKQSIKYFESVNSPYEILNRTTKEGEYLYKRYEELDKKYTKLLFDATKFVGKDKLFVFLYNSDKTSFTGDLANEILHNNRNKIVLIGRKKDDKVILSIRSRSKKIVDCLEKALIGIDGYGGGHDYACGGCVNINDFDRFIINLKKELFD